MTTTRFLKYPSLVNHYALGKSRRVVALYDTPWVETEKIHGANASIVLDKDEYGHIYVATAKRSGFINMDDKQFTRFKTWVKDNYAIVEQGAKFLDWQDVTQVHIFGEYFGGNVQKMEYELCKQGEIDFKVFNVILEYGDGAIHYVLDKDTVAKYLSSKYLAKVKETKTLREFVEGYPDVDSEYGGVSEGSVYQPKHGYILNDTYGFLGVKYKTKEYAEVTKQKVSVKPKVEYAPEFIELMENVSAYVTANRLSNVLSHGEFELVPQSIGKIMVAFKDDVVKEYIAEQEPELEPADVLSAVSKHNGKIALLIKDAITQDSLKNL